MEKLIMTEEEILAACKDIGAKLSEVLKGEEKIPVCVGVLKGGANFMMDLIKRIEVPVYCDFLQTSSYEGSFHTSGKVRLIKDIQFDITDRVVVLIDDVVDSGLSMSFLVEHLKLQKPKRIIICSLFDKVNARKCDIKVDYTGKVLTENDFLVGYGLDYQEIYRNVPYVFVASKNDVDSWDYIIHKSHLEKK